MAHGVACPFCGFQKDAEYEIRVHIEKHHTEDSPFNIINSAPDSPPRHPGTEAQGEGESEWTRCTRKGCGEHVMRADIQEHLDLHEAIEASEQDDGGARMSRGQASEATRQDRPKTRSGNSSSDDATAGNPRRHSDDSRQRNRWEGRSSGQSTKSSALRKTGSSSTRDTSLLSWLSGSSTRARPPLPPRPPRRIEEPREPGRLGKAELGPHAFEKSMPAEVRHRLLHDALPRQINRIGRDGRTVRESFIDNETSDLIRVLADLCARSRGTEVAYFCHPCVKHVHKIRCDGNFCGYWNIQMMSSFLAYNTRDTGLLPNVLEIQDVIEKAWDNEICSYSRIETGGIRGTRKWIGTHDALAYFTQQGFTMQASSFRYEDDEQSAVVSLLDHLEAYFIGGLEGAETRRSSHITQLPPIYFQRAGHSMTIVGLEREKDGHRNLMIFDPSFGTTRSMDRILDGGRSNAHPHALLKPYRRSDEGLSRWNEFEILM